MTFCSTTEAAERSGVSWWRLNRLVADKLVTPRRLHETGEARWSGHWDDLRWRAEDITAARAAGAVISPQPDGKSRDLARLAAEACYAWHGRARFVVVALPDSITPAWTAAGVVDVAKGLTVCTVVSLEDGSDG